jgi:glycosyltransferase involved in cell wall biosynthesis
MSNSEIAILLPYKENYNIKNAGSASLWVKDFFLNSKLKSKTSIYGINKINKPLTKNFINLKNNMPAFFLKRNITYARVFLKNLLKSNSKVIEIHNRPEIFNYLKKKNSNYKYILVFHNDPNKLRGSKTTREKTYILNNCDALIFVSNYVKKQFFLGLNRSSSKKAFVIYPAIKRLHNFPKKECLITFFGKLNTSKGYNLVGEAVVKILNRYKNWKAIFAGDDEKEKYNFKHKNLKIYKWLSHDKILNFLKKSSICLIPSVWNEPFGRISMEASAYGNATIISNKGGLPETSKYHIKLNNLDLSSIFKEINNLIIDMKKLAKLQKKSFFDKSISIEKSVKKFDDIKVKILENNY